MWPTVRRLALSEWRRLVLVSVSMLLWFLLIMAAVRNALSDVQLKTHMMGDTAFSRGFGLKQSTSPDAVIAQLTGVSFSHPIVLALVGSVTVAFGVRACQGELERGTLEVTLAHAVSRTRYLFGYLVVMLFSVVVLMVVTWASMVGFERILDVPGTLDAGRAAWTCLNAGLVFISFGAIGLLMSVLMARRGGAMFTTVGILSAMYALTFAERAWSYDWLDWLGRASVFHWLDPGNTLLDAPLAASTLVVPALVSMACVAVALWMFERRDL